MDLKTLLNNASKLFLRILRFIKERVITVMPEGKDEKALNVLQSLKQELLKGITGRRKETETVFKKAVRGKKRERATFSEYWERANKNNSLILLLIVTTLLALGTLGAYLFEIGRNEGFKSLWDSLWYAIVTITTTGYGDRFPISVGGRIIGILMMALGVTTVGIVTGNIASFLVDKQIKARGGLIVLDRKKGHFIICGWKSELESILENVIRVNPHLGASNIVLVNDADPEEIDHIRSIPKFKTIKFIKGDYIDEKVLLRANVKKASTALVLADAGKKYSVQEVDSRTVMAVISINSMNKDIYVCAELIDEKFEKYLRLANCDEIILTRAYSRVLIANAASASGISHIASELLKSKEGGLTTEDFPQKFIGKPFADLQRYFKEVYGGILIGILENTGKIHYRKKEALAEAQKNPDIVKIIENLQIVKRLTSNKPVLNPDESYVIKKNSRAILITKTATESSTTEGA